MQGFPQTYLSTVWTRGEMEGAGRRNPGEGTSRIFFLPYLPLPPVSPEASLPLWARLHNTPVTVCSGCPNKAPQSSNNRHSFFPLRSQVSGLEVQDQGASRAASSRRFSPCIASRTLPCEPCWVPISSSTRQSYGIRSPRHDLILT